MENRTKKAARMKVYNATREVKDRTNRRQRAERLTSVGRARWLIKSARHRAKQNGLPFDLTFEWVAYRIENCICPYTMQPFILVSGRHPWAPSLDRIDNTKGYTQDNVNVVSLWWNVAKNEWPQEITALALIGLRRALQDMEFGP
jgi:hypothetical protein